MIKLVSSCSVILSISLSPSTRQTRKGRTKSQALLPSIFFVSNEDCKKLDQEIVVDFNNQRLCMLLRGQELIPVRPLHFWKQGYECPAKTIGISWYI